MSKGLDRIRERMTQYLREQGINAVSAWPLEERERRETAVVAVSLRRCKAGPCGFQDYLGERFNEQTGRWEELYGRKAELTFGIDLYARADVGEERLQDCFDRLLEALQNGGPEGLTILEVSCGETQYQNGARLLKREAQAVCGAYLYAVAEPGGAFLDFEIRGGMSK